MGMLQALYEYNGLLYAAWKGEVNDDRLFYSEWNGRYWTEQDFVGGNSSAGPSAAGFGNKMMLAWKGEFADERLFCLEVRNGLWDAQVQIPGFLSSTGPALAEYEDRLFAIWKGAGTDQALWFSSYDGHSWTPQATIPYVASAVGPSACVYQNRLYAAWRGMNNDQALRFSSFDGGHWAAQARIPGASAVGPSLAVLGGKLYAAWRGVTGDETLWFSSYDGTAWAAQQTISEAQSSTGPALATYGQKIAAMWKGPDADQRLRFTTFDGTNWASPSFIPGNTGQDTPQNIGLRMQYQETTLWCWLAVGVSVANYYGNSIPNQCGTMTDVAHTVNNWPLAQCCPPRPWLRAHPSVQSALDDPYDTAAEFVLQNAPITPKCIKSGGVDTVLGMYGNLGAGTNSMSLDQVTTEIAGRRPVVVDITWTDGKGHSVAVAGVLNDLLLIADPANGETVIEYESFPAGYKGGATANNWYTTKAP